MASQHTWMHLAVIALLIGFGDLLVGSARQQAGSAQDEYMDIDGSKNPELIPEWLVWENSFRLLAIARRDGSVEVPATIGLSDAGLAAVLKEAERQPDRDHACEQRLERMRPLLFIEKVEVINEKTEALQIECRTATLQARDRIFRALSPEDGTMLIAWVNEGKRGIRARVRKADLAHFRRPE